MWWSCNFSRFATSVLSAVAQNRGYGYDLNGNMTNDGLFVYEWDDADRLRSVRSVANGQTLMTCTYDGLSRRREKVEFTESGAITTRYVYVEEHGAGWLPLIVHVSGPGTNQSLELYTHGPDLSGTLGGAGGIGGMLSCHGGTGSTPSYFHCDGNGNVIALTSTNGTLISRLDYAPYGSVLLQFGPAPRFQWSSKEWDCVVGLAYFGYRYYQAGFAIFLNKDPFGDVVLTPALYKFSANDPVNALDLYGLITVPYLFVTFYCDMCIPVLSLDIKNVPRLIRILYNLVSLGSFVYDLSPKVCARFTDYTEVPDCYVVVDENARDEWAIDGWHFSGGAGDPTTFLKVCFDLHHTIEWEWGPNTNDPCCE